VQKGPILPLQKMQKNLQIQIFAVSLHSRSTGTFFEQLRK